MSENDPTEDPRVPLAYERTELAHDRNRWSAERTLMAWIRTSLAMVAFGFAVDKFLAYFPPNPEDATHRDSFWLGIALVCVGILFLVLAIAEHVLILRRLGKHHGVFQSRFSLPLFAATIILLIGFAALLLMLFH